MLPSPGLGDQTALVEEPLDDDNFEAQDILDHSHPVDFDVCCEVFPSPDRVPVDRPVVGDDERDHHCLPHFLFPCFLRGPFSVLVILLFEGPVHGVGRRDLHNNDHLPPLASGFASEPHKVGLEPGSGNSTLLLPLLGPPVLGSDGDLVVGGPHSFLIIPSLLVGDQSSLDEDVVEEDVHHDVVPRVDVAAHLAAADDVLRIQRKPCFAAPTHRLRSPFREQFIPLSNTEEVLLDFTNYSHRLRGAVQSPPCLLEEVHVNRALVRDDLFRN